AGRGAHDLVSRANDLRHSHRSDLQAHIDPAHIAFGHRGRRALRQLLTWPVSVYCPESRLEIPHEGGVMSKTKAVMAAAVLGLAGLLTPRPLSAHATAAIVGTVRDSSGGAIAGARMVLTTPLTGLVESRTTAADGSYSIPL